MPVQIGAPPSPGYSSPLALLSDCHRRIEHFLEVLARVGESIGEELTHRDALATALRYFEHAAPKHTADEEQSLFPRLRGISGEEMKSALVQMERLESDHTAADRLHAIVLEIGRRWLDGEPIARVDVAEFRRCISDLRNIYEAHICLEDQQIFPLAERLLTCDTKVTIGEEMATRRRG